MPACSLQVARCHLHYADFGIVQTIPKLKLCRNFPSSTENIKDERVVQLIKRYLKSGVMENGVVIDTEEGSPQGGNLSPLLANVYLNEFDQEFLKRGVPCIRYADYTEVETMPKLSFKHRKYHRFPLKISA